MDTQYTDNAERARSLAEMGASHEDIAAHLGISPGKLRRLYKRELQKGVAEGNLRVAETLYIAAKSGSNLNATTLWLKARCGWRDTGLVPRPPHVISPKLVINLNQHDKLCPTTTDASPLPGARQNS
ncbi:MAG TPA: hypothetical protein VH302_03060 [Bryobacteraceae bacterium]|jgi:hypothetical protein|nr:hypothetical protein [Bryobacteraceae bacterium]